MSYDVIGNIAILKQGKGNKKKALRLLKENKNIKTVLEKTERVKGRLRTIKTKLLAGVKSKEAIYVENNCRFRLNVEKCYFSPRLASERLEIANQVKRGEKILVMFTGVAPYPIVIAKNSKAKKIISIELSRIANIYARENVKLNKLDNVEIIQGDVKKVIPELFRKEKFDRIVIPPLNLRGNFLSYAFKISKKSTVINYYDFGKDVESIIEKVQKEARKARKKIKITCFKKAGEIAPYKFRWRVDMVVK